MSTTHTHTPGPWFLSPIVSRCGEKGEARRYYAIVTTAPPPASREHVVDLDLGYGKKTDEGNACLMAAAPDLLEALRRMVERVECFQPGSLWPELGLANLAIAKAEGSTP